MVVVDVSTTSEVETDDIDALVVEMKLSADREQAASPKTATTAHKTRVGIKPRTYKVSRSPAGTKWSVRR